MNDSPDTKTRILDTAERLFAATGLEGTSLRSITREAQVNLAAVNYHFGSKEGLIKAVISRRLEPLNRERLRRLDRLEAGGEGGLEALVEAFVGPPLEFSRDTRAGGDRFVRLMGRSYAEHADFLHEHLRALNEPVVARFKPAFRQALPHLPKEELYWRLHFVVGAMSYTMAGNDMMHLLATAQRVEPDDSRVITRRLVPFVVAGLQAPAPGEALEEDAATQHKRATERG